MKNIIALLLISVSTAFADNVVVVNAPSSPVPIFQPSSTTVTSTALEASHVIKAGPGNLVSLAITDSVAEFVLIINATSVPGNGAVTLLYPPIKTVVGHLIVPFPSPLKASTGIVVANSSTGTFTLTAGGSTCIFSAQVQ